MRPQLILIALIGIIFTIVDARSYFTYLNNRPVIDLNKKPAPTTPKSILERRSAMFPKGHLKVVELPTKSPKYSPVRKSSQNTFIKNININPKVQGLKVTENVRSKLTELAPKITENRMPESNIIGSNFFNKTSTTEPKSVPRNLPIIDGLRNNSSVRKTVSNDNLSNSKVHKEIDEDEYSDWTSRKRQVRSVNIIEEENLATTMAGFKFTGREPRVLSHQGFRNIHS